MYRATVRHRFKTALMACATGLCLMTAPAAAQQVDPNKLLEIMVTKGVVTRAEADAMIAQASTTPAPPQQAAVPPGGVSGDTQTIPYIPQVVRDQLKEELRTELAGKAQTEGWARPGEVAEWTKRITLSGDIRVRGDGVLQGDGNFPVSFPNYQAINAGPGYDISPGNQAPAPFLNTTEDRYRARVRARLGVGVRVDDWINAEVRIATGSDRSPVSTNQTLGGNGEFGKYAIWLDRANIRFKPFDGVETVFGRFANPFWTSELMFDEDLNFDGVATSVRYPFNDRFAVFGTGGAFPIFNSEFNFGSNESGPYSSRDKYLLGGQLGVEFKPTDDLALRLAGAYFHFGNVLGKVSSPCQFFEEVCDTDDTRPLFLQFGNSLFPIRDVVPDPTNPINGPEVQYFGLTSRFHVLNVHGQIDYAGFGDVGVRLEGDFIKNLGFDRRRTTLLAVNNLGPSTLVPNPNQDPNDPDDDTIPNPGPWAGGDSGWYVNLLVGKPDLLELGDWRAFVGYRHIESDATLDAFNDSDFHNIGGTNAKGFTVGAGYAIGKGTAIGARWLSADAITGIPLATDVIQLDLTTHF